MEQLLLLLGIGILVILYGRRDGTGTEPSTRSTRPRYTPRPLARPAAAHHADEDYDDDDEDDDDEPESEADEWL